MLNRTNNSTGPVHPRLARIYAKRHTVTSVATAIGRTKGLVSKSLSGELPAGELVKHLAAVGNGRGGGRSDMAEGGVADEASLDRALAESASWVGERLQ